MFQKCPLPAPLSQIVDQGVSRYASPCRSMQATPVRRIHGPARICEGRPVARSDPAQGRLHELSGSSVFVHVVFRSRANLVDMIRVDARKPIARLAESIQKVAPQHSGGEAVAKLLYVVINRNPRQMAVPLT